MAAGEVALSPVNSARAAAMATSEPPTSFRSPLALLTALAPPGMPRWPETDGPTTLRLGAAAPTRGRRWRCPLAQAALLRGGVVGEVGLRKHRPCPPTLETFGVHTASVSRKDPSLHEH
jgi:hypothetical protein